jgi:hypothetical protein
LAFDPILKQVGYPERLLPILDSHNNDSPMQRFLGKTRIVVLREAVDVDISTRIPVAPEKDTELIVLNSLATFRYGFTQQMASLLLSQLGYTGIAVRNILQSLKERGHLNYTIRGEFYIPGRSGRPPIDQTPAAMTVKRHYAAALALAPYLSSSTKLPSISFDRAFLPEYIHEAEYHLVEALRSAHEDNNVRNTVEDALNRLRCFADVQGWHTVRHLDKYYPKYVYDLATELLEAQKASGYIPHPTYFIKVAKAAEEWLNSRRNDKTVDKHKEVEELRAKILYLYEQAERACEAYATEIDVNRLLVKTRYATFLHKHHTTDEDNAQKKRLNDEALKVWSPEINGKVATGEWYEMLGDDAIEPLDKEEKYLMGVKCVPQYGQLWIKLVGASISAHGNLHSIQSYLHDLPKEQAIGIIKWAERYYRRKKNQYEYSPIVKNGIYEMKSTSLVDHPEPSESPLSFQLNHRFLTTSCNKQRAALLQYLTLNTSP